MAYITLSSGLTLKVPTRGTRNWADEVLNNNFKKISEHDHTGSGKGLPIGTSALSSGAVTLAKMADLATDRLIGRDTAGTGAPEALTLSGGLGFTGSGGIEIANGGVTLAKIASAAMNGDDVADLATVQQVQNSGFLWGGTAGGTGNALTITLSPAPSAYATGMFFRAIASASNTGSATINVNGLGAKTIYYQNGRTLLGGELITNRNYEFFYNGTGVVLLNPSRDWTSFSPTITPNVGSLSGTSNSCRWMIVDCHSIRLQWRLSGTISGSIPTYLDSTIPFTAADTLPAGFFAGAASISGGDPDVLFGVRNSTTNLRIYARYEIGTYDLRFEHIYALA